MNKYRKYFIQGFILVVALTFCSRLYYLQIINDELKVEVKRRTVKKISVTPYRGTVFDRNWKLLATNAPLYDLMVVIKKARKNPFNDTTRFCNILRITKEEFDQKIEKISEERNNILIPQILVEKLNAEEYARIVDLFHYDGFFFERSESRAYPHTTLASTLGYVAEIGPREKENDKSNYYVAGDYVGKTGIEKSFETQLRGVKGIKKVIKDAKGVIKSAYMSGKQDTSAVAGNSLITSIDLNLQQYGDSLMANKVGSIVAIEPKTGEILAIVSSPSYDPNLLTGKYFGTNYTKLSKDSTRPLLERATQAPYPPGSTFKTIVGLIGLQEGIITPSSVWPVGWGCVADHAPPGMYTVARAIQKSSNNYFCMLFKRTVQRQVKEDWHEDSKHGLDIWRKHVQSFGIGTSFGSDLPQSNSGFVPDSKYYMRKWPNTRWNSQTIFSLGIGQGEMSITPLQMANFTAAIANRGYYIPPHVVKGFFHDRNKIQWLEYDRRKTTIDSKHFETIIDGMAAVVEPGGTASRARMDSIEICGKTGTAQNPHGDDHSHFIAFAPRDNPKIAIAVTVENSGYGGTWAAPIASLMIEKYLLGEIKRKYLEAYILEYKKQ